MCGPNVIVDLRVKLQKRRNLEWKSVGDAEAASGSTMEEPWPKPVNDLQKSPKVPARRALHSVPQFPRPEVSRSHGGFSPSSQTSRGSPRLKWQSDLRQSPPQRKRAGQLNGSVRRECRADAEEEGLFVSIRVRVDDNQRQHRRRGILL